MAQSALLIINENRDEERIKGTHVPNAKAAQHAGADPLRSAAAQPQNRWADDEKIHDNQAASRWPTGGRMGLIEFQIFSAYFWTQFDSGSLFLLYALGYSFVWVGYRVAPPEIRRWPIMRPFLAFVPPFLAIGLASTTYVCPVCHSPTSPGWCEVAVMGIPFPARITPTDLSRWGPPTEWTDSCGEWSFSPYDKVPHNVATAANTVVGLAAMPALLGYLRMKRERPHTTSQPSSRA